MGHGAHVALAIPRALTYSFLVATAKGPDSEADGGPRQMNPSAATYPIFARRQRVHVSRLVGPRFEKDWSEKATIVGRHPPGAMAPADDHWYVIRYEDGGMLSSHASNLMASNEPPFKGKLPTYRSTQRRH